MAVRRFAVAALALVLLAAALQATLVSAQCTEGANGCWDCDGDVCTRCMLLHSRDPSNNGTCFECASGCATCSGTAKTACLSCTGASEQLFPNGECGHMFGDCASASQPYNYTHDPAATYCTSCPDGRYLDNGACLNCYYSCGTCTGPNADDCLSCSRSDYMLFDDGTCDTCKAERCDTCATTSPYDCAWDGCERFFFVDGEESSGGGVCTQCSWECHDCVGAADFCTACNYVSSTLFDDGHCGSCHYECETCSSADKTLCLSCRDGTVLVDGKCVQCASPCLTCSGPGADECTACHYNSRTLVDGYCNATMPECFGSYTSEWDSSTAPNPGSQSGCEACEGHGYLWDDTAGECARCASGCLSCNSTSPGDCTSCDDVNSWLQVNETASVCRDEWYCHNSCAPGSCFDTGARNCTACRDGLAFEDGRCMCFWNCATCHGHASTDCLTCYETDAVLLASGRCGWCSDEHCDECTDIFSGNCTKCSAGYWLQPDNTCAPCTNSDCGALGCAQDDGDFCLDCVYNAHVLFADGMCGSCSYDCLAGHCIGPTADECTACARGKLLVDGTCVPCDDWACDTCNATVSECTSCYYSFESLYDTGACEMCHQTCKECSAASASSCTECFSRYYLSGGGTCEKCAPSCAECSGAASNECTACFDGDAVDSGGSCAALPDCYDGLCANDAVCVDETPDDGAFLCNCTTATGGPFAGELCDVAHDCISHVCANGASCLPGTDAFNGQYDCDCAAAAGGPWTGEYCDTLVGATTTTTTTGAPMSTTAAVETTTTTGGDTGGSGGTTTLMATTTSGGTTGTTTANSDSSSGTGGNAATTTAADGSSSDVSSSDADAMVFIAGGAGAAALLCCCVGVLLARRRRRGVTKRAGDSEAVEMVTSPSAATGGALLSLERGASFERRDTSEMARLHEPFSETAYSNILASERESRESFGITKSSVYSAGGEEERDSRGKYQSFHDVAAYTAIPFDDTFKKAVDGNGGDGEQRYQPAPRDPSASAASATNTERAANSAYADMKFTELVAELNASKFKIDYQLLDIRDELGKGSFGVVSSAMYRGELVAVKRAENASEYSNKAMKEFLKEVLISCSIPRHVNCVFVYGACMDPLLLVMELCPGGSLIDVVLDWSHAYTIRFIVHVMEQVAEGMLHLHNQGVVHRDLAARNVLLAKDGIVKLSDYGFARVNDDDYMAAGKTEATVGPIKWLAPEAITDGLYSKRSDVWSFGVLVLELFDRCPPWLGTPAIQVALKVSNGATPDIGDVVPDVVHRLLEMCFRREPRSRPSFREIAEYCHRLAQRGKSGGGGGGGGNSSWA